MKDCINCSQKQNVFNAAPVPFVVHENMRAQMDTHARRLVRVIVLLVLLLAASNGAWLWHEFRYETVRIEQTNDNGINNYIGNDGDIFNGEPSNNLP